MKAKEYTVSVYTENNIGILSRIATIFLRRHINIESFTTSESEIENVFRFVVVVSITENQVKKIIGQIEKQIEVIKAYYHLNKETIHQESALYKMSTDRFFKDYDLQKIIKKHNAKIVTASREYVVLEKTGIRRETQDLYDDLKPYNILQFVRSGRISVSKMPMNIKQLLN